MFSVLAILLVLLGSLWRANFLYQQSTAELYHHIESRTLESIPPGHYQADPQNDPVKIADSPDHLFYFIHVPFVLS